MGETVGEAVGAGELVGIEHPRVVVIAGAGAAATSIAKELRGHVPSIKIIEIDRHRAETVAASLGGVEVIHGDATDVSVLRNERIDQADAFITTTGHDDTNLMAALIGEEMGVENVITLVRRSETSKLWEQAGTLTAVSPRYLAAARINEYIENGFQADMTSLHGGALQVLQRTVYDASPVVGASLAEINPPPGLLVGAVVRGDGVFIPKSSDRLRAQDQVVLFVNQTELHTVQLFFPGPAAE